MIKVITYGTYDHLHRGHIRLLRRAKALGDYLIVGVTADDFDRERGKINVQQSLIERIEAVKATGIPDEIIVEEYEGQKIDDILRLGVDIFTVGSDWRGKFDYLSKYCRVIYLERTEGVSSTNLRAEENSLRLGLKGESPLINKVASESHFVNGIKISGVSYGYGKYINPSLRRLRKESYDSLLDCSDAVYIVSPPEQHYDQIRRALERGKHVLSESPVAVTVKQWDELSHLAREKGLVLFDAVKTAYSTAYYRMLLLAGSGRIGTVVSVDAVCTSQTNLESASDLDLPHIWNSINAWGPTALLPIFQLLGTEYSSKKIISHALDGHPDFDAFTKVDFIYPHAVASMKVGQGVKSEGELVISGTRGYIYVPAPWWKTDYFELRFENSADNRRYFYQLDGEGIRFELLSFLRAVKDRTDMSYVSPAVSRAIVSVIEDFNARRDFVAI